MQYLGRTALCMMWACCLSAVSFMFLGVPCRRVAGGCLCVSKLLLVGLVCSLSLLVALCRWDLWGLTADCCLVDAGVSCSFSLALHDRLSLCLSPLVSLPACTSVSLAVRARDPVALG